MAIEIGRIMQLYINLKREVGALAEHNDIEVVSGGAKGADSCADEACNALQINFHRYPAKWLTLKKAAGPIRNSEMLKRNPDIVLVLAFHDDLLNSKGTRDMIKKAKAKGIKVKHIKHTSSKSGA